MAVGASDGLEHGSVDIPVTIILGPLTVYPSFLAAVKEMITVMA